MGIKKKKNTIPKHIFKINKLLALIRIIINNKNTQDSKERERERERESTQIFLWGKYGLNERNDIEFIQNKMGRRRVKI